MKNKTLSEKRYKLKWINEADIDEDMGDLLLWKKKDIKEFIKDFQNFLKLKRRWTRVELMDWIKENAGEELIESSLSCYDHISADLIEKERSGEND